MIHMVQCLCGPARHAIMGLLYDDKDVPPEEAKGFLEGAVEGAIAGGSINRRCEMCDREIVDFLYEDGITKEQDFAMAIFAAKLSEEMQCRAQELVKAQRRAARN